MRILLILLLFVLPSNAATWNALSTSLVDVSNAVTSASSGDIVVLPASTNVWTYGLLVDKAVRLTGSRALGGGGDTAVIIENRPTTGPILQASGFSGFGRIDHFIIICSNRASPILQAGTITTTNIVRIDHMTITNLGGAGFTQRGISFQGWSLGVADHNIVMAATVGQCLDVDGLFDNSGIASTNGVGIATNRAPTWDTIALSPGTTNMAVFETNWLSFVDGGGNGLSDMYGGGRAAYRFQVTTNSGFGGHGTDSSGTSRSPVWYEVYGNTMYLTPLGSAFPFSFRGGSGLFASNTIVSTHPSPATFIRIDDYRSSGTNIYTFIPPYGPWTNNPAPCCGPWGPSSPLNYYMGQEDATGYPSLDQIGRGPPTIYGTTNITQTLSPLYGWANTLNGVQSFDFSNATPFVNVGQYAYIPNSTNYIKSGRDYYNQTVHPTWVPLTYPHPLVMLDNSDTGMGAGSATTPTTTNSPPIIIGGVLIRGGVNLKVAQ